ncbi:MAG: flagellar basal body rod protein FlgC [Psychrobium sp.]|nr:flagellar basal body rod protein FlgC [Psychrobium sp.]
MSIYNIFDVAASGMSAQSLRLNVTASNIANANSVSSSREETYRGRHPVFAAHMQKAADKDQMSVPVQVLGIVEDQDPLRQEYNPNHPLADKDGFIYKPNVNVMEEMANMMSASRSYQTNVQVADAAKQMLMHTLRLGK